MSRLRRRLLVPADERGFTILEVTVAMGLFALVALGLATSTKAGLNLIGGSSGKQTATQLGARWMEESRGLPYDALGMDATTTYETASSSPDSAVNQGAGTYDAGSGAETLVVLPSGVEGVQHELAQNYNGFNFTLYRYVTWVQQGSDAQALKRVTVVVQWPGKNAVGAPNRVALNTLVSLNQIAWDEGAPTSSTTPASTTTSSSTSTTSTTVPGSCDGDVTAPSGTFSILAGTGANTGYTSSSAVNLSIGVTDPCAPVSMAFSNDGASYSAFETLSSSKVWSLTAGNGNRTVYARFRDGAGNTSSASATVRVDGTLPTTPSSYALSRNHGQQYARLDWHASTDNDTLIGYRIYKKIGNGAFQNLPPGVTAGACCGFTDNDVQQGLTYSYYVVAYDAAGNQSVATATQTVTI